LVSGKDCLAKYYPNGTNLSEYSAIYGIERTNFYNVFESIISSLISREHVRIRNFIRFREYSLPNVNIHRQAGLVPGERYPLIVLIHLLGQFFARPMDLEAALKTLAEEFESDYSTGKPKYHNNSGIEKLIIQYSLPFLYEFDFLGDTSSQRQFQFQNEIGNATTIIYAYHHGLLNDGITYINSVGGHSTTLNQDGTLTGEIINRPNAYWMLYKAILRCRKSKLELRLFNL